MDSVQYLFLDPSAERAQFGRSLGEISPFDAGIPLLDLSSDAIREIYYYRQHSFCKHIRCSNAGYIVTEFYPDVPWAGKYNTIPCPAGHHLYEGRWLHDRSYLENYARFWFTEEADPRRYSFWAANAVLAFCRVTGHLKTAEELYPALCENYRAWEEKAGLENGLFYQKDGKDGMEYSISGHGARPTICSYMYGDAVALSEIAGRLGRKEEQTLYAEKARKIKERVDRLLWDEEACFYKTRSEHLGYALSDVRELIGYVPWYFGLPDADKSEAWRYLNDKRCFDAPYGPTTAEISHPDFMKTFDHECLWNGPSWPFATSQTLTALGNLLADYEQSTVCRSDYFRWLERYAKEQYLKENGKTSPYIDENLDPYTGVWLARAILRTMSDPPGGIHRGEDYNHSTFCDLVLSGLVGIRPASSEVLSLKPMFEEADLAYLCADGILYHGHSLTVLWDRDGDRFGVGAGLFVYLDGSLCASSAQLCDLEILLKE